MEKRGSEKKLSPTTGGPYLLLHHSCLCQTSFVGSTMNRLFYRLLDLFRSLRWYNPFPSLNVLSIILLYSMTNAAPPEPVTGTAPKKESPVQAKININTAPAMELQKLPGIGPSLAQRIIEFRSQNPPFRRIEDLLIIKGINRKVLNKIRPYIYL
jgi:competence ComEA-like helix-hairpin-helix protein